MRSATIAGLVTSVALLGACTSTMPQSEPSAYTSAMATPIPENAYPVIEGKRQAATTQMSNEEAAQQQARLSGLAGARASGAISEAEYQRRMNEMRLLAANHGADTLNQIKN